MVRQALVASGRRWRAEISGWRPRGGEGGGGTGQVVRPDYEEVWPLDDDEEAEARTEWETPPPDVRRVVVVMVSWWPPVPDVRARACTPSPSTWTSRFSPAAPLPELVNVRMPGSSPTSAFVSVCSSQCAVVDARLARDVRCFQNKETMLMSMYYPHTTSTDRPDGHASSVQAHTGREAPTTCMSSCWLWAWMLGGHTVVVVDVTALAQLVDHGVHVEEAAVLDIAPVLRATAPLFEIISRAVKACSM